MVLKILDTMGTMHGWGIARRIDQMSNASIHLNYGTLYPALIRLEQQDWISSQWGLSEKNRRAKFYSLTKKGRRQLAAEQENWEQMAAFITRVLETS